MVNSTADAAANTVVLPKTHTYKSLDAWRGIASLWVVLYHTSAPLGQKFNLYAHRAFLFPLDGYLGVSIFFVISGYCIAHAATQALGLENGLRNYAIARFRRIYYPCLFSLPFYFSLGILATFLVSHHYLKSSALAQQGTLHQGALYYVANITLTQKIFHQEYLSPVCWTLCYEVAFYVIVGLAIASQRRTERQLLTGLHLLTIAALVYLLILPQSAFYPLDQWPLFGLGVMVYDLIKHRKSVTQAAFLIASVLFVIFSWQNYGGFVERNNGAAFLSALVVAMLFWILHRYDNRLMNFRITKFFSWLGLFSYSLYLTHWLVVGLVLQVLGKVHLEFPWICLIISPLVSVAAAFGFYQLFEKPFIRKKSLAVQVKS